jgi:hypothetical protein
MTDKKCAHPACSCMVDANSKYCSEYCHDARDTLEIACNCGHAGCEVPVESELIGERHSA